MNASDSPRITDLSASGSARRKLLAKMIFLGIGAILVKLGTMLTAFLTPPRPLNRFGGLVRAGQLNAAPPAGSPPKHIPLGRFWLIHEPEGISAVHSSCTHLNCLFTWDTEKGMFICPCHGSEFQKDGKVVKGPATRDLDRFTVQLVDEEGTVIRSSWPVAGEPLPVADLLAPVKEEDTENKPAIRKNIRIRVDTSKPLTATTRTSN